MTQRPDSQMFEVLKTFYSWLGDEYQPLLQAFYPTWKQLAGADRGNLHTMLSEIPHSPGITWGQLDAILAFAKEKARIQEEETT